MGKPISPEEQAWVDGLYKVLGDKPAPKAESSATATKPMSAEASGGPSPDGDIPSPDGALPLTPRFTDPLDLTPRLTPEMMEQMRLDDEKRKKEAEDACRKAQKWLEGLQNDELRKLGYPGVLAKIKEKFPAVGDLPKPKTLMDMVEKVLRKKGYGILDDPHKMAMEKMIAAYIAALPKSIKAKVSDGGITLVMAGTGGAPGSSKAKGEKGEKFEFKNKHYTIEVENNAWQALDPKLRVKWKSLNDEASALEKLLAKLDSLKKEWESSKPDGTSSKVELEARVKDLEAEFNGRWKTLKESIDATAKLTTDGIKATVTETKKKSKDEKVGAELELKFEDMSVALKTFAQTPDLKTALTITGSAEKITAKIEAEALKSGTVVTLAYEKALKEVKEQLELQIKHGKTKIAATLSKEAVKLEDKLKELQDSQTKDFQAVKALEDGLEKLQAEVKVEFEVGNFKVAAGGKIASGGEVGGKVKVDFMLEEGIQFLGEGQKISFTADVSNKGYEFALMFSVGEMPELDEVHKANKEADERIRELYDVVKENKIRSLDDAKKIKEELTKVIKPLKKSVEAMKKVDKKKFAVEVGVTVTGDFPSDGGRMPPPVAGVGVRIVF